MAWWRYLCLSQYLGGTICDGTHPSDVSSNHSAARPGPPHGRITGLQYEARPRFGEFCSGCSLPVLPHLACRFSQPGNSLILEPCTCSRIVVVVIGQAGIRHDMASSEGGDGGGGGLFKTGNSPSVLTDFDSSFAYWWNGGKSRAARPRECKFLVLFYNCGTDILMTFWNVGVLTLNRSKVVSILSISTICTQFVTIMSAICQWYNVMSRFNLYFHHI